MCKELADVNTSKGLLRIKELKRLNSQNNAFVNQRLYRLFYDKELFIIAYEKLKSNKGSLTRASTRETMDGMSISRIEKLIDSMKSEKWQPRLARRILIPKSNGKSRPLGIQGPEEKLVQEVMRMILEAIYDTDFSTYSHGFRANKSCLTAMDQIRKNFDGVSFVIEGDFSKCFDSFNHEILVNIIRKRISDQKFINLIYKLLKAGYLQINRPTSYSVVYPHMGTPQGSIVSPMFANIYLHELDIFIMDLITSHEKTTRPKKNPNANQYLTGVKRLNRELATVNDPAKRKDLLKEITRLQLEKIKIPSIRETVKIYYVRYADDWIIGINGPISLAKKLKKRISEFTQTSLDIELNIEKTHITDIRNGGTVHFLGYNLKLQKRGRVIKRFDSNGHKFYKGSTGHKIKLLLPCKKLVSSLYNKGYCDENGFPLAYKKWSIFDDHLIVRAFNTVRAGLINYYCLVDNSSQFFRLDYILRYSLAKTLAQRHKKSMSAIFKKHGKIIKVEYNDSKGKTVKTSMPKFRSFKPSLKAMPSVDPFKVHMGRLTRSRLKNPCLICHSSESVEMHHIKHVRKNGKRTGERTFTAFMGLINRKQVPVCAECHRHIHKGTYDGIALTELARICQKKKK